MSDILARTGNQVSKMHFLLRISILYLHSLYIINGFLILYLTLLLTGQIGGVGNSHV